MADETTPLDLIRVIRGNKGLTVIAIGGAALLLFYLYRQSQAVSAGIAGTTTPTGATTAPTAFAPAQGSYTYVQVLRQPSAPPIATSAPTVSVPVTVTPAPVTIIPTTPPTVAPPVVSPPTSSQGLLGANVRVFPNYKGPGTMYYRSPRTNGQILPIPLPAGTRYTPGGAGRYWYYLPGSNVQMLLTSGG